MFLNLTRFDFTRTSTTTGQPVRMTTEYKKTLGAATRTSPMTPSLSLRTLSRRGCLARGSPQRNCGAIFDVVILILMVGQGLNSQLNEDPYPPEGHTHKYTDTQLISAHYHLMSLITTVTRGHGTNKPYHCKRPLTQYRIVMYLFFHANNNRYAHLSCNSDHVG